MSYAHACQTGFTADQATRMCAAAMLFRANLVSSQNGINAGISPGPHITVKQLKCNTFLFSIDECYDSYDVAWNFGDGSIAGPGSVVAHAYCLPGTYTVTADLTLGGGVRRHAEVQVTVVLGCGELSCNCPAVPWNQVCFEQDGYFCMTNQFGGAYYMDWLEPAFANPTGFCQNLAGLQQGDPLVFVIHIYNNGIFQCDYYVNTILQCQTGPDFGGGGVGGGGKKSLEQQNTTEEISISLFPIPASESLAVTLSSPSDGMGTLQVYDLNGRLVTEENIKYTSGSNTFMINVALLEAGFYEMRVIDKQSSQFKVKSFIVQKN